MSEHFISREEAESDILSCAAFLAERIKSGDGLAEAMRAVVPRYLAKGNVDLAAELSNTVGDPYSRDKLLILVAEKCAELDDDEYALQLADAIEDHGLQSQARERIAIRMAMKGDFGKAQSVADVMAHPDFVYAAIAARQSAGGDETAAFRTLEAIEFASARVSALQAMASANLSNNESEKAVEYLEKAVLAANEIEHDEEKIRALCDLGGLFIEAGRNDKAIETLGAASGFAEILDNVHRDYFLATASLGFLHAGSIELADRALDAVTDKTQMASCMLGFAREFWKREEKTEALESLEEAYAILKSQREIETRDSRAKFGLFSTIAVQFAGFGKTERAMEIAQENPDEDEQMSAFAQIAQILTLQREDELARQAVQAIGEDSNRLFALVGMSEAKVKLGSNAEAVMILNEAAELAETVPQMASRTAVLNELAGRFVDLGETEKARAVLSESFETIAQIRAESSQAAALANVADIYTEANFDLGQCETEILHMLVRNADR